MTAVKLDDRVIDFGGLTPHGAPPRYFTFPSLEAAGLPHASTTRHCDGVTSPSEPTAPFRKDAADVLREAGLHLARMSYARQVHGAEVARAPAGGGYAGEADILVTTEPGVPLAIFTADCLAITLYDADARALVLAHVGWRGAARGAAPAAVTALRAAGGRPQHARVTIAPSIGPCCYEVDEPVVSAFGGTYPDRWQRWFTPRSPRRWTLDLWTANEDLLVAAGVDPARIENPRVCTACHIDLLYSYRKGHRGRLVTVAALP